MGDQSSSPEYNPLSRKAAARVAADVLLGEHNNSAIFSASVMASVLDADDASDNDEGSNSPQTKSDLRKRRRKPQIGSGGGGGVYAAATVKASATKPEKLHPQKVEEGANAEGNDAKKISSSSGDKGKQQRTTQPSNSYGTNGDTTFYLTDPLRPYKTLYAFITCILPTCCAVLLSLAVVAPDWLRSEAFQFKKSGDYLAAYFEIPDRSFAAISPLSPNITCIPMYMPSAVSIAQAQYLNFLSSSSYSELTSSSTSAFGGNGGVAGDATAAAKAIVAVSPFGCRDLGDAVTGVSWLHVALCFVLFMNAALSVYELASRGPYGGDRSTARVSFILALAGFAINLLAVVGWYLVAHLHYCGKQSLAERGFRFGWPFVSYCALLVAVLLDVLHSGRAIARISRGPPSIAIVARTIEACWAAVGIFAQGFLRHGVIESLTISGYAEACLEFAAEYPCSDMKLYTLLLLGAVAFAILICLLTVFFVSARAIDHKGRTLNHTVVTGVIMCLAAVALAVAVFGIASINGKVCDRVGVPSVWDSGFKLGVAAWVMAPLILCCFTFTIMNILYQCRCTERIEVIDLWTARGGGGGSSSLRNLNDNNDNGAASPLSKNLSPSQEAKHAALRRHSSHYNNIAQTLGIGEGDIVGLSSSSLLPSTQILNNSKDAFRGSNSNNSNNPVNRSKFAQKPGGGGGRSAASGAGARYLHRRKSMYHWFWFDGLTDSRTASILKREVQDADEVGYEDEIVEQDDDGNDDDENHLQQDGKKHATAQEEKSERVEQGKETIRSGQNPQKASDSDEGDKAGVSKGNLGAFYGKNRQGPNWCATSSSALEQRRSPKMEEIAD